jgi:hypothetical protein
VAEEARGRTRTIGVPTFRIDADLAWKRQGNCVTSGANIDLWFSTLNDEKRLAKALCDSCTVEDLCLDYAKANREGFGIWGGERFQDGKIGQLCTGRNWDAPAGATA